MACPAAADLRRYLVGDLPPAGLERVAAHLRRCPACLKALPKLGGPPDPLLTALRHALDELHPVEDEACRRAVEKTLADQPQCR